MHSSGTGPVTLFWGTILTWGKGTFFVWAAEEVISGDKAPKYPLVAPGLYPVLKL